MAARNYSSTAVRATLTAGVTSGATTFPVSSTTGWPTAPFTVIVDRGLSTEEVCEVTALAGLNATVTRGVDSTSATAHAAGATVEHGISARDFDEANDHVNATTGHGATGAVVGTTNTQTLTNKTLTSPILGGSITTASGATFDRLPAPGDIASRPTPTGFAVRWNTELSRLEAYDGSTWHVIDFTGGIMYGAYDQSTTALTGSTAADSFADSAASVSFTTASDNTKVLIEISALVTDSNGSNPNYPNVFQLLAKVDGSSVGTNGIMKQNMFGSSYSVTSYTVRGDAIVNLATAGSHTVIGRLKVSNSAVSGNVSYVQNVAVRVTPLSG